MSDAADALQVITRVADLAHDAPNGLHLAVLFSVVQLAERDDVELLQTIADLIIATKGNSHENG